MSSKEKAVYEKMQAALNEINESYFSEGSTVTMESFIDSRQEKCDAFAEILVCSGLTNVSKVFMQSVLCLVDSQDRWNFFNFIRKVDSPTKDALADGLLFSYNTSWQDDIYETKQIFKETGRDNLLRAEFEYDKDAKKFYDSLPARVTIYRGTCVEETENRRYGISWTTDLKTAEFFAYRFGKEGRCILKAEVLKKDIMAIMTSRNESEVIVLNPRLIEKIA